MRSPKARELLFAALALFLTVGIFFLALRHRLGPLYETVLIEPSGLLQQRPWMDFNGKELRRGFFPLWNPYTGFGQPHLANIQTAVFYPLNLIVYLLGPKTGFELWLFIRLWLGGFFLYLFLRRLKLDIIPGFAGSLVWPLGGYGLWFMQLVDLNSQLLLPVFLILFYELAQKARLKIFLLAAVIGALIILGGHPEAIFNSFIIAGLYFLFRIFQERLKTREKTARLILAGFATVLSVLLAAVVLVPFANYFHRCWTLHYPGFGFFHLDIRTVLSLFFPERHFPSRGPGAIAVELLTEGLGRVFRAGYAKSAVPGVLPGAGIIVMLLALAGLFKLRSARADFSFFGLVLVFLLGMTYGIAPFRWLAFLPPFSAASNYKFYYSEIYFCLSLLAALGFSWLVQRRKLVFKAVLLLVLIASLFIYSLFVKPYLEIGLQDLEGKLTLKGFRDGYLKKPYSRVAAYETSVAGTGNPIFPPNTAMLFGVTDIRSSDALFPEAYFRLMDQLNGIRPQDRLRYFYPKYYVRPLAGSLNRALLDKYGLSWIFGGFSSPRLASPHFRFVAGYEHRDFPGDDFSIFENEKSWPRAFMVSEIFSPLESAQILERSRADIVFYNAGRIEADTESAKSGNLVVADLYYPGWLAQIEGKPARVVGSFGGFRSLSLEPGRHRVEFRFKPLDFEIGSKLSLAGLIMISAVWCVSLALRRADGKTA